MILEINSRVLELVRGNIATERVDAVVNAANSSLLGGGGVDGAIHHAAGPELLAECRKLNGCETGSAKITRGYALPSRYVIHAVGPVYPRDPVAAPGLLASAYRSCLEIAVTHELSSLAFPSISTGAYCFPVDEAAAIALHEARTHLEGDTTLNLIRFVLFDKETFKAYANALS